MITAKDFIPDKNSGERLVANIWPHPIVFIKIIASCLFLFILPVIFLYGITYAYPQIVENQILTAFFSAACFSYYLFVLMFSLFIWMTNYLDVWTVTTGRIISRRQNGLFSRTVSELELYRVQDITSEQKGFLPTVLNYGDLYIQSAGEQERFVYRNIANPTGMARTIQKLDEEAKVKFNRPSV
ncbi:MAG: PH domain-containing protein [Candidatus Buchananbacteria bacterium]|jgi:hypothetical protein